jgi:hypothetical protein
MAHGARDNGIKVTLRGTDHEMPVVWSCETIRGCENCSPRQFHSMFLHFCLSIFGTVCDNMIDLG